MGASELNRSCPAEQQGFETMRKEKGVGVTTKKQREKQSACVPDLKLDAGLIAHCHRLCQERR